MLKNWLNDKYILLKGVSRHPTNIERGFVVTQKRRPLIFTNFLLDNKYICYPSSQYDGSK